jgi:hypothetical protein
MAIFVLFLVANLAIALLVLTHNEEQLSLADGRTKRVFYLAEAGLEDARRTLFLTNGEGPFNDDLIDAAGDDLNISFDLAALEPTFDGAGNVTGFNGVGDDEPLTPITAFGDGIYAAYLTNDPVEGRTVKNDANDRVMLTSIGVGPDRSIEVVQAIVQPKRPFPLTRPASRAATAARAAACSCPRWAPSARTRRSRWSPACSAPTARISPPGPTAAPTRSWT